MRSEIKKTWFSYLSQNLITSAKLITDAEMRTYSSVLLSLSTMSLFFAIWVSIPQVRANPAPVFEPKVVMPDPFVFFVAEICGLIVGASILIFGAEQTVERVVKTLILTMGLSYLLAYVIWSMIFDSGIIFNSSMVSQEILIVLIPEVLGTAIGTLLIKKALEVRWTWALFSMSALMITSLFVAQLL